MGAEKYVKRRGYALASAVALMFFLTVVLGVALSHLDYSSEVTEAWLNRVQARNALESMTSLSRRWLASELRKGGAAGHQELTESDSLRIFALQYYDGCEVTVYNLACADSSGTIPQSFPGGYMIRAVAEKDGMARLVLESVYTAEPIPGGDGQILDEEPVYSREIFRD